MAGDLDRLSDTARDAIASSEVVVSAVVIWEVAIKRRLGKLEAPADLLSRLEQSGVDLLPITARHADRVGELPLHHRDPFDRLLIAQADCADLAVVSADEQLKRYDVKVIW
jgi:PIN domain nuclease of toxin-antitoxin system